MGQYQQWLQYREREHQLRARLEELEAELAELQARALLLQEPGSYEQNSLLHLLVQATNLNFAPPQADSSHNGAETPLSSTQMSAVEGYDAAGAEGETNGLFPWNGLLDVRMPADREATVPSTPLAHPQIELLPEDMGPFFDEHTQTAPQLQLPWWMRQRVATPPPGQANQRNIPIDQERMRNNREIERWLERWRRQSGNAEQEGGS
jgi:hypothetical protein